MGALEGGGGRVGERRCGGGSVRGGGAPHTTTGPVLRPPQGEAGRDPTPDTPSLRPAGERATPTHVRRREQKHESGACRARAHEVLVIDHP